MYNFGDMPDPIEMLEKCYAEIAGHPKTQVDHGPRHVKSPNDLKEGRWYRKNYEHLNGDGTKILIIEKREKTFLYRSERGWETEDHYTDCGLAPYTSVLGEKTWNPTNWIENLEDTHV